MVITASDRYLSRLLLLLRPIVLILPLEHRTNRAAVLEEIDGAVREPRPSGNGAVLETLNGERD